jgi:hypothetical protein
MDPGALRKHLRAARVKTSVKPGAGPLAPQDTDNRSVCISAANAARQFNVGVEIDYENSSNPNLTGLQSLVTPTTRLSLRCHRAELC